MMRENQKDMEKPHTPEELAILMETHSHLKSMEVELTQIQRNRDYQANPIFARTYDPESLSLPPVI